MLFLYRKLLAPATGGAWLSSARVVRCWVKSRKRAQPLLLVAIIQLGTLADRRTGERDDANHHAPYDLGYTRATMVGTTS